MRIIYKRRRSIAMVWLLETTRKNCLLETTKSQAWLATSTVSTWFDIFWQCTSATPDAWPCTTSFEGNLHLSLREMNNQCQNCLTPDSRFQAIFWYHFDVLLPPLWYFFGVPKVDPHPAARSTSQRPQVAALWRPSNDGRCISLPAVDTAMWRSSCWISKQIQSRPRSCWVQKIGYVYIHTKNNIAYDNYDIM